MTTGDSVWGGGESSQASLLITGLDKVVVQTSINLCLSVIRLLTELQCHSSCNGKKMPLILISRQR